jgi:hypothetical protein
MTAVPWKVLFAVVVGSAAGALLRQGTLLLAASGGSSPQVAYSITGIGGVVFGALLGWLAGSTVAEGARRQLVMLALVAALATFAAGGALSLPSSGPDERTLYLGALHIATAILAGAAGLGVVRWLARR